MLRLAADENFNGDIVRGLLRRNPKLDIVRVQDVGLSGADDLSVLQGQSMPGVFEVRSVTAVGQAIDDLILLAECSFEGEWEGQVRFLPL